MTSFSAALWQMYVVSFIKWPPHHLCSLPAIMHWKLFLQMAWNLFSSGQFNIKLYREVNCLVPKMVKYWEMPSSYLDPARNTASFVEFQRCMIINTKLFTVLSWSLFGNHNLAMASNLHFSEYFHRSNDDLEYLGFLGGVDLADDLHLSSFGR